MPEIKKEIMKQAKIITWLWIGLTWLFLIFLGFVLVTVFWDYGGSLVQLMFVTNGGLVIGFIIIIVCLTSFTFFFYHTLRDWFYALLYKRQEKLESESELLRLMKKIAEQDALIKQLRTDNKHLLALVNNKYDGMKQVPERKSGVELPRPMPVPKFNLAG